ncbi:MAG: NAD+ kinase [Natronomonas sp.]|jgi:NAD+ kinase|uniref:ATP-NAD kinase n=1 Tax=Natronomonas sp. TaxID=2184060 RepID=UPI0039896A39
MSGQRVGIIGDGGLADVVETAGGEAVVGLPEKLDDVSIVLAAGEAALVEVARAPVDAPVLPVDAGAGVRSVPRSAVESALERLLERAAPTERHPVISARGAFAAVDALLDVALMAAEPARISEFSVRCDGEQVARFRADGVVASTPAGSVGYNSAADGPAVAPETDVLSVVPVAPFATDADRWILPADEVVLSVERDETPVELLADGRTERTVAAGDPVTLSHSADLETFVVPESGRFF